MQHARSDQIYSVPPRPQLGQRMRTSRRPRGSTRRTLQRIQLPALSWMGFAHPASAPRPVEPRNRQERFCAAMPTVQPRPNPGCAATSITIPLGRAELPSPDALHWPAKLRSHRLRAYEASSTDAQRGMASGPGTLAGRCGGTRARHGTGSAGSSASTRSSNGACAGACIADACIAVAAASSRRRARRAQHRAGSVCGYARGGNGGSSAPPGRKAGASCRSLRGRCS